MLAIFAVDMEWLIGSGGANEVDIGYCSLMRLYSLSRSQEWQTTDTQADYDNINNRQTTHTQADDDDMQWSEEIAYSTAVSNIDKQFYPFKEVSVHVCMCCTLVSCDSRCHICRSLMP